MRLLKILLMVGIIGSFMVGAAMGYLLYTLDGDKVKALIISKSKAATGREVEINGIVEPHLALSPTLVIHDVTFANAAWAKKPALISAKDVFISFSLRHLLQGNLVITDLALGDATIGLETSKSGKHNWDFSIEDINAENAEEAVKDAEKDKIAFLIQNLALKQSRISYRDHREKRSYKLEIHTFTALNLSDKRVDSLDLDATFQGARLQAKGAMQGEILQLSLQAKTLKTSLAGEAKLSLKDMTYEGTLNMTSSELRDMLTLADVKNEDMTPVYIKATFGGTPELVSANTLDLHYGNIKSSGKLHLNLQTPKPDISGALHTPLIDTSWFADTTSLNTPPAEAAQVQEQTPDQRVIPDIKIPLAVLKQITSSIDITIDKLIAGEMVLENIKTKALIAENTLKLSPLNADFAEGKLEMQLTSNAGIEPPSHALELTLKDAKMQAIASQFGADQSIEGGNLRLTLRLTGSGDQLRPMLGAANGWFDFYADKASYRQNRMEQRALQEAGEFFDALKQDGKSDVRLKCAIGQFHIKEGVAESDILAFKTNAALVSGDGRMNLGNEKLRMRLAVSSSSVGLADFAPPLLLTGTMANPSVTLDTERSLLSIGKLVLGAVTGVGIIAVVGEQVTDRLGITEKRNPCLGEIMEDVENIVKDAQ